MLKMFTALALLSFTGARHYLIKTAGRNWWMNTFGFWLKLFQWPTLSDEKKRSPESRADYSDFGPPDLGEPFMIHFPVFMLSFFYWLVDINYITGDDYDLSSDILKKICDNLGNPAQNPLCKDVAGGGDYSQGKIRFVYFFLSHNSLHKFIL